MESFHRTHPRFSPRDKYTIAFPFSFFFLFSTNHICTHTYTYVHTRIYPFFRFNDFRGEYPEKSAIREKLGRTGWKYRHCSTVGFRSFKKGPRKRRTTLYLFSSVVAREACRLRAMAYAYRFDEFHPKFSAGTHPSRFTQYFGNLL